MAHLTCSQSYLSVSDFYYDLLCHRTSIITKSRQSKYYCLVVDIDGSDFQSDLCQHARIMVLIVDAQMLEINDPKLTLPGQLDVYCVM